MTTFKPPFSAWEAGDLKTAVSYASLEAKEVRFTYTAFILLHYNNTMPKTPKLTSNRTQVNRIISL